MNMTVRLDDRVERDAISSGEQFVTFLIEDQMFGVPALAVRDVLRQQQLTKVPLARPEIAGAINLRGHIVTAIDVRARLGSSARPSGAGFMCVVVEADGESYCLLVDAVGDVISVQASEIESSPGSLQASWINVVRGVTRTGGQLVLILDVRQLLEF